MKFLKEHVSTSSQDKQKLISEIQNLKGNESSLRREVEEASEKNFQLETELKNQQ